MWFVAKVAILGVALLAGVANAGSDNAVIWSQPIWKATPIPENPDARFHKQDPYGLAIGRHIPTRCSIYWVYPGDGNLYCFNSLTSKAFFIDKPEYYIKKAKAFLDSENSKETRVRKCTQMPDGMIAYAKGGQTELRSKPNANRHNANEHNANEQVAMALLD